MADAEMSPDQDEIARWPNSAAAIEDLVKKGREGRLSTAEQVRLAEICNRLRLDVLRVDTYIRERVKESERVAKLFSRKGPK